MGGELIPHSLIIKGYSKTHYGYLDPNCNKIVLFPLDERGDMNYKEVLETYIHEYVHLIQWSDPSFVRKEGVMHNKEFYDILTMLMRKEVLNIRGGKTKDVC